VGAVDIRSQLTAGGRPVVVAALDRADRRNALDLATVDALTGLMVTEQDRTIILTSATPGIFCAGADLKVSGAERAAVSDRLYALYELMVSRPGLVVAAVDGAAVGGGAQLVSAADFRVASPRARFRWVGPRHGLVVGAWILPALLGRSRAMDLMLTGRWMAVDEASAAGYVHRVAEDPVTEAVALIDELSQARPDAIARVKTLLSLGVMDGLRAERVGNGDTWDGSVPDRAAASEGAQPQTAPRHAGIDRPKGFPRAFDGPPTP